MRTITTNKASQECQPMLSIVYVTSEVSQYVESRHYEDHVQSPHVPPSLVVVDHEKFTKFLPSMDNSVALLDTYTYDSASKKVSRKIIKIIKVKEDLEEEVTEQHVLVENTYANPMVTTTTCQALAEATKYNIVAMSHQLQAKDVEIARLQLELEQSRKKITALVINTISFDNFLGCAQITLDEIHSVQQELYPKVADFLDLFVKIQIHV